MQDFSIKMNIAVRDDVVSWQFANTVGHIAAYLGNKMREPFDTGEYFTSKDGMNYPRNSQFPIVVLRASKNDLKNLAAELRASNLLWIVYVQEMINMADDEELAKAMNMISADGMNVLGIGIFGGKEELKKYTGVLRLWR